MKTIWKFPLQVTRNQHIAMPAHAHLLRVQAQGDQLVLWALVDTDEPLEQVPMAMYGTGHQLPEDWGVYFDTAQQGPFVWHFFQPEF